MCMYIKKNYPEQFDFVSSDYVSARIGDPELLLINIQ